MFVLSLVKKHYRLQFYMVSEFPSRLLASEPGRPVAKWATLHQLVASGDEPHLSPS